MSRSRSSRPKNDFCAVLLGGAGGETLSSMIDALQAWVRRWRVLGVAHWHRSDKRSAEAMRDVDALVAAIAAGVSRLAERIAPSEIMSAASEALSPIGKYEQI